MFFDSAAMTSSLQFQTTTPIPASLVSAKTAPLKFVLKQSAARAFHLTILERCRGTVAGFFFLPKLL